jgi:2-oxoglutarate dehydrogenase E1 component
MCKSSLADMAEGSRFKRLIPEVATLRPDEKINKVIFCTGQVYYALARSREANKIDDIAIVRVEQISPFPFDLVRDQAERYPNASIVWAQEEPMNMGAWTYVEPRIETALRHSENHKTKRPAYAGRDPTGAVATGNKKMHEQQEWNLLSQALLGEMRQPKKVS